jgi:hypothetical protein
MHRIKNLTMIIVEALQGRQSNSMNLVMSSKSLSQQITR